MFTGVLNDISVGYKERAYVYYKTLYMDRNMYSIYPNYEPLCEKKEDFTLQKRLLLLYVYIDASIFIGQVKHLEFDLIRNQSH